MDSAASCSFPILHQSATATSIPTFILGFSWEKSNKISKQLILDGDCDTVRFVPVVQFVQVRPVRRGSASHASSSRTCIFQPLWYYIRWEFRCWYSSYDSSGPMKSGHRSCCNHYESQLQLQLVRPREERSSQLLSSSRIDFLISYDSSSSWRAVIAAAVFVANRIPA